MATTARRCRHSPQCGAPPRGRMRMRRTMTHAQDRAPVMRMRRTAHPCCARTSGARDTQRIGARRGTGVVPLKPPHARSLLAPPYYWNDTVLYCQLTLSAALAMSESADSAQQTLLRHPTRFYARGVAHVVVHRQRHALRDAYDSIWSSGHTDSTPAPSARPALLQSCANFQAPSQTRMSHSAC